MGLFSSKKEDSDASVPSTPRKEDKSVVQAIRARFHGRKGKEREDPKISFSGASPSSISISIASSPVNNKRSARSIISVPAFRRVVHDRAAAATPTHERALPDLPLSSPETAPRSTSSSLENQVNGASTSNVSRRTTDNVTVTLAQRLDELASANNEGLLNDDEYRILRQSLFERFASSAAVPSEPSVIPTITTSPEPSTSRRISHLKPDRPPSIVSKSSGTSGAHNLLRRLTDRRPNTNDRSDTSSLISTKSNTSLFKIPLLLSRKASDSSIRTAASRVQTDAISVSSRRFSLDKGHGDRSLPPSTPRSAAGSIRRMPVPPSSFNARLISQARHSAMYNVFYENHLNTVQEIQQEISNVESEQKRLVDAFNGLELTTLTRRQRLPPYKRSAEFSKASRVGESNWGDSDGRSQRRELTDDGISLRSGTSAGTSPSMARSAHGLRIKTSLAPPINNSPSPLPLLRQGSLSSFDDRRTPVQLSSSASPGFLQAASKSNISLHSRNSRVGILDDEKPMSAVHIDVGDSVEGEMEDIRRRREEVNHRYEARLEYLRAKLKGAQLHEKVMRR